MAGYSPGFYRCIRWLVKTFYLGSRGGLRAVGVENLPRTGGVILAPNHVSHLDPPAACCVIDRHVHCMAKEELFRNPLFGRLIRMLAAFPVRRGEGDTEAIRTAMRLVESGEVVLVFPEGTRGDAVSLQSINRGVAMLAKRTGAPVVPVGIVGTHIVMPRDKNRKPRKHPIVVAYGSPFTYKEVSTGANDRENRELFARELQVRLAELCRQNGLELKIDVERSALEGSSARAPETAASPAEGA